MTGPAPGQLRLLRALVRFQAEHGYQPSVRELTAELGHTGLNGTHALPCRPD